MNRLDLRVLIPNLVTLTGLCFGLSSIRYALEFNFNLAVICILLAGICDVLDGMLARQLKSESELGAQLDSLSDFLSFGIAPGLLLYMTIFNQNSSLGAFAALAFIVFSCLRLGLYNVKQEEAKIPDDKPYFFTGIPTPMGALLILLPLTHTFLGYDWAYNHLNFVAGYTILISGLLVSQIPTFSVKRGRPQVKSRILFLILFSLIVLSLINFLWVTLNLIAAAYILSIPFSIWAWRGRER
ncbi:MAG: CDP-diacylglycerol--serine O-phosphatidyltransferase [Proteobacteria bacterium]|nr:CDP-diacylglycerol--serine O-phosphatidyltransferase [Pseudomonadota bacterium]MDA0881063.1 CDP-diacylglycerol--serine O-phosphatidyltransferase [Pseudomonadota bacterium]